MSFLDVLLGKPLADSAEGGERIGPAATLRALIEGTALVPILAAGHHGEQRVANLEALIEKARALEDRGGRAFVRWLAELASGASASSKRRYGY